MMSPQEYKEYQDQQSALLEELSVLMALDHQCLYDGSLRDGHAEGLLDMVQVWQQSKSAQLDVHGMMWL